LNDIAAEKNRLNDRKVFVSVENSN